MLVLATSPQGPQSGGRGKHRSPGQSVKRFRELAQSLESAGFVVRGIVAADTLGLPRQVEMSSPRFDPQALARPVSVL